LVGTLGNGGDAPILLKNSLVEEKVKYWFVRGFGIRNKMLNLIRLSNNTARILPLLRGHRLFQHNPPIPVVRRTRSQTTRSDIQEIFCGRAEDRRVTHEASKAKGALSSANPSSGAYQNAELSNK